MNESLESLEHQYFWLRGNFGTFKASGATPAQLDELRSQIVRSRQNYWSAIGSILHDDDPAVEALVAKLNAAQDNLVAIVGHLENIAKVLDVITKAVDIGSQLAAKAVTL